MSKQRIRGKWNHYTGLFTSFQAEFWSITDIHQNISLLKKKKLTSTQQLHIHTSQEANSSLGLPSSIRKITAFNSFKTTTASKQTKAWGHVNLPFFHTALYCLCPLETAHNNNLSKITAFQQQKKNTSVNLLWVIVLPNKQPWTINQLNKQTNPLNRFGACRVEEDHGSIYFICSPLQSSTDEKEEMAVRAGEDTGTEEGLQAGKEKKARPVQVSVPTCQTNRFSVRK